MIGIAVLLAVLGDQAVDPAPAAFPAAWWVMTVTGLVAAGCGVALGRVRARDTGAPAAATARPAGTGAPDGARAPAQAQ